MSTVDPQAAERLAARRGHLARIRKRIATLGATVFAVVWGVIFVQLVSGHDPALSGHKAASSGASSTASSGNTSAARATAITTSQS